MSPAALAELSPWQRRIIQQHDRCIAMQAMTRPIAMPPPPPPKSPVHVRLLADLKPQADALIAAINEFEEWRKPYVRLANPQFAASEIKAQMTEKDLTHERLAELGKELTRYSNISKEEQFHAARRVRAEFETRVQKPLLSFLQEAEAKVGGYLAEARNEETLFFGRFQLPREETSVSRNIQAFSETLASMRSGIAGVVTVGSGTACPTGKPWLAFLQQ